MSEPMVVMGFDPGTSVATLVTESWGEGQTPRGVLSLPSYVGSGSLQRVLNGRRGAGQGKLELNEHALEIDGVGYFVGQLAQAESDDATNQRGDNRRYYNGHALRLLLALCRAAFPEQAAVTMRVVTGVPVAVYQDTPDIEQRIAHSLLGSHRYRYNGQPRSVTVEAARVMQEGAAAALTLGKIGAKSIGIVDSGGRTSDVVVISGSKVVTNRSGSVSKGVEDIGDELSAAFQRTHGRPLKLEEKEAVLRAYATGSAQPVLYARGRPVQLNGEVARAACKVGEDIANYIGGIWRVGETGEVGSDLAEVIYIGGGAYYFADVVGDALDTVVRRTATPELDNARGYKVFGDYLERQQAW